MRVHSGGRNAALVAAALAVAGATGLAATVVAGAGTLAVAGSALPLLVGAGVLLGHGFDAAFDAWPRSRPLVPVMVVAAGVLGVGDAAGAFGRVEPMGLPASVALVAVGLYLLVGWRGQAPAAGWREHSERRRPRER